MCMWSQWIQEIKCMWSQWIQEIK